MKPTAPFRNKSTVFATAPCLLALIRIEGISTVLAVALFGIIWAIWTPDWIEQKLKKAFGHFLLLVFGVSLLNTALCFYMLFAGFS
jgi:hypothetical protein